MFKKNNLMNEKNENREWFENLAHSAANINSA